MTQPRIPLSDTDVVDLLCERVRELEAALKDVCDEHLHQCDSRKPRPALIRALDVLHMRKPDPR
jgi:hypothetical protein